MSDAKCTCRYFKYEGLDCFQIDIDCPVHGTEAMMEHQRAIEKDAERYRYMAADPGYRASMEWCDDKATMDEYIDAEMAALTPRADI